MPSYWAFFIPWSVISLEIVASGIGWGWEIKKISKHIMLAMANKLDNMKQIAENKLKFKLSLLFPLQRLYTLEGPYFWLYCPHREILLQKVMFTSRSRVFIENSCSKKERCNVTGEVLKRFHIWVKNSHRLLSLRILRSKRRILRSPMPDENPEDVTLGSQC